MAKGREPKGKSIKKTIYIFTEGETEKNYFSILNQKYNSSATVKVSISHASKQGMALLKHAIGTINTLKKTDRSNLGGAYIIFDKDEIPHNDIETVLKEAKEANIHIGFSNSCFEVWLLAHFIIPNHSHTKQKIYEALENKLKCTQYARDHKNNRQLLKLLEDHVSTAIQNTSSMEALTQMVIKQEPYTNIGQIIQEIYNRDIY